MAKKGKPSKKKGAKKKAATTAMAPETATAAAESEAAAGAAAGGGAPGAAMSVEEASRELLECARYGEAPELRQVMAIEGGDINSVGHGGNTALHLASANGHLECAKILVAAQASVRVNDSGNTPLRE